MPITPRYSLTQTTSHLQIEVSIPHVRVSTSTLELRIVDGTEVNLYAPPTYLLRLTLPGRVIDEDAVEDSLSNSAIIGLNCNCSIIQEEDGEDGELQPKAVQKLLTKDDLPKLQYNPEKNHGTLVIVLQKEEQGFWEDLDLLGRLQQPSQTRQMKKAMNNPLVQEINENGDVESRSSNKVVNNDTRQMMEECLSVQKTMSYGLFNGYSNVFRDYAREGLVHEMLECPNPDEIISNGDDDNIVLEEQYRRELRLQTENEKFDEDRYINDLHIEHECDMVFDSAVMMKPHWIEDNNNQSDGNPFFSSEESHLLAEIPRHDTLMNLSVEQQKSGLLCLVDILFAYVYDHRTTDGDPTVESSWTVMILSPTLSWLEHYNPPYDTLDNVLQWSIRRSLIYPYLRSYNLAKLIAEDVSRILKCGRRTVIRCLLQLHKIMEQSESHYLFNKLYIDPMIGWVQQCKENEVQQFGIEVEQSCTSDDDVLGKQCLGLDLVGIEERFFENARETSSSDDDNDSSCSVDYESDDESGCDTEEVTTDEEVAKTSTEHKHSAALLDENIGLEESRLIHVMGKLVVDE